VRSMDVAYKAPIAFKEDIDIQLLQPKLEWNGGPIIQIDQVTISISFLQVFRAEVPDPLL